MIFMTQDMAMPFISTRHIKLCNYTRYKARQHYFSIFPALLLQIIQLRLTNQMNVGQFSCVFFKSSLELLPANNLELYKMQMDRMCIFCGIIEFPYLGIVQLYIFCDRVCEVHSAAINSAQHRFYSLKFIFGFKQQQFSCRAALN